MAFPFPAHVIFSGPPRTVPSCDLFPCGDQNLHHARIGNPQVSTRAGKAVHGIGMEGADKSRCGQDKQEPDEARVSQLDNSNWPTPWLFS